jgi:uncharacterized membrane protein YkvA (DUF1232 family)
MFEKLKSWARALKRDVLAVYIAAKHPRVSWGVKVLALATAAYVFSPIDLIPDFIPIIGYLDDLILVPAALWLILRQVPAEIIAECRAEAERQFAENGPVSVWAAATVVVIWVLCGFGVWWWFIDVGGAVSIQ